MRLSDWLRDRPWVWILVLLGTLVLSSIAFLIVALRHPPQPA